MAGTYFANGMIPLDLLVNLGGNHYLPPGTALRWRWMVQDCKARYGVTLRITGDNDGLGGWNAYRPFAAQVRYRQHYGIGAAVPGSSSHGGTYHGLQCMAIDVTNWMELGWTEFNKLCQKHGFRTNFVTPTELWHIADFNDPWHVPSGGGSTPEIEEPIEEYPEEEEIMKLYMITDSGAVTYAVAGPKYWFEFNGTAPNGPELANRLAGLYNKIGPTVTGTETAINLTYQQWNLLKAASLGADEDGPE